jgi:small subunit ribosomal protein S21
LPQAPASVRAHASDVGRAGGGPLSFRFVVFGRSSGDIELREGADGLMQIIVRDNNVDQALRALKKKLQREGVYREMKLRRHYEKPSEKRAREKAAAIRRARKLDRKRAERDGQR